MLKFSLTSEPGESKAEIMFPNKNGVEVVRTQTPGEPDSFDVTIIKEIEGRIDIYPSTSILTDELGCNEIVEKIRTLSPD